MIESETNCFQNLILPSPDELVPLSQTLITPNLANAFDINLSPENSPDTDPARAIKRPRLVWTPQLHKRFVDAVAHLGIKNAVPKTIMQLMSVDGLTRENVASHLQKYRLYLKRMQGIGSGSGIDPAMDRLFSSSPVPALFLQGGENLSPFSVIRGNGFGANMGYDHSFVMGQSQNGRGVYSSLNMYVDDVANGRRELTLFPTGEDD